MIDHWLTDGCDHTIECTECGAILWGDEPRHAVICPICLIDWESDEIVDDDERSEWVAQMIELQVAWTDLDERVQDYIDEDDYYAQMKERWSD